jgi:hypothetical protein
VAAGLFLVRPTVAAAVTGTVAGTVFEDFDADGTMDAGSSAPSTASATDVGVKGVAVTVTDSTGAVLPPPQRTPPAPSPRR